MQCPTHKKKLQKIVDLTDQICEICGRAASLECKSCNFRQCGDCRICNQRHNMQKIVDLGKVKSEYNNNKYICDSCKKHATLDDDGIWHCNECLYGLCPECAD